jgi:hypothetical protein
MSTTTATEMTAPHEHRNGLGIASFCTALPAAVMGLIPILGIPALCAGLVAFGLGLAGGRRIRQGRADNKVMTILGTLAGVLAIALGIYGIYTVTHSLDQLTTDLNNINTGS